jgi:hypothetical protein
MLPFHRFALPETYPLWKRGGAFGAIDLRFSAACCCY